MIIIAASLYLPEHITRVASRAWFYYAGDESAGSASEAMKTVVVSATAGTTKEL